MEGIVQTKYAIIDRDVLREIQHKANRYDAVLPLLILVAGSDKVDPDCCISYWRGELRALLAAQGERHE